MGREEIDKVKSLNLGNRPQTPLVKAPGTPLATENVKSQNVKKVVQNLNSPRPQLLKSNTVLGSSGSFQGTKLRKTICK